MFVTDGYGNARVHKFAADGTSLLLGRAGHRPGTVQPADGVWIDRRGRVLVCDRENDRVQVFSQDGQAPRDLADQADRSGDVLRGCPSSPPDCGAPRAGE